MNLELYEQLSPFILSIGDELNIPKSHIKITVIDNSLTLGIYDIANPNISELSLQIKFIHNYHELKNGSSKLKIYNSISKYVFEYDDLIIDTKKNQLTFCEYKDATTRYYVDYNKESYFNKNLTVDIKFKYEYLQKLFDDFSSIDGKNLLEIILIKPKG